MRLFGLIGYPLSHSFSASYFNAKFREEKIADAEFRNFPLSDIALFPDLIEEHSTLCGLAVTIPYKESVLPFMDELTAEARECGAVNCIRISAGKSIGHNTDVTGFEKSLTPVLPEGEISALVLGTGGASKAVSVVLSKLHISHRFVSRKPKSEWEISYDALTAEMIEGNRLIINCTPLGMYPDVEGFPPIPYEFISAGHLLYDLVYNPAETRFLAFGKELGAKVSNGLDMLHFQAEANWSFWNQSSQ